MVRTCFGRVDLAAASATLAFVAGAAAPGAAEAQTVRVSAVVETADAIFFQPTGLPEVVWYFPRSEVRLFPVTPPTPGANFWRAAVELVDVRVRLGELRPDWEGKSLVPFIVRPTVECVLRRVPEMRFVTQEVRALGRDVSPAIEVPVCQFAFRLPLIIPDELAARLEELRASGTLIARDLPIRLDLRSSVAWSVVHAAVAAAIQDDGDGDDDGSDGGDGGDDGGEGLGPELTPQEARAAIEAALASKELAEVNAEMTDEERLAFIEEVLLQLFEAGDEGGLVLTDEPPPGQLVHHQELIERSM